MGKTAKSKTDFEAILINLAKKKRLFSYLFGLFIPLFSSLKYGLEKGKNATCVCLLGSTGKAYGRELG